MRKITLAALLPVLLFSLSAQADQFDDAYAAFHVGNLDKARQLAAPLAEKGYPDAQELLAETYESLTDENGDLSKSEARRLNAEAAKWFLKAAEQGNVDAQYNLGWIYEEGWLGKPDYVQAYKWFSLSEKGHYDPTRFQDPANKRTRALKTKMTPAQVEEAKRLVREWKPVHTHLPPLPSTTDKDYQHAAAPSPAPKK